MIRLPKLIDDCRFVLLLSCGCVLINIALAAPPTSRCSAQQGHAERTALQAEVGDPASTPPTHEATLSRKWAATQQELQQLADDATAEGEHELAAWCRNWELSAPNDRQLCFLPSSYRQFRLWEKGTDLERRWVAIRRQRSQLLFQQAEDFVKEAADVSRAIRAMYAALREDPTHGLANRTLGITPTNAPKKVVRARDREPNLGWPPGSYRRVRTAHFQVFSNASTEVTQRLADVCETYFHVWRQLFAEHWCDADQLQTSIARNRTLATTGTPFRVVMFAERSQFVSRLQPLEAQIELATGLYRDQDRTTYLYAGDESLQSTWIHELTHQLFQETATEGPGTAPAHNFWALEGVALYCESLRLRTDHALVGGWDAPRVQVARYRRLVEREDEPIELLASLNKQQLQTHPDIRRIYTQSAGLAHFLMDADNGRHQSSFVRLLQQLYRSPSQTLTLAQVVELPWLELERAYEDYLTVTDEQLQQLRELVPPNEWQQLALGGTQVTGEGLQYLCGAQRLDWLDLHRLPIADQHLACLADMVQLQRLNLAGTAITDEGLRHLAGAIRLEELDLSGTQITSHGLAQLAAQHPRLRGLWLTGTAVNAAGLVSLEQLKHLRTLDIQNTGISRQQWPAIAARMPSVELVGDPP